MPASWRMLISVCSTGRSEASVAATVDSRLLCFYLFFFEALCCLPSISLFRYQVPIQRRTRTTRQHRAAMLRCELSHIPFQAMARLQDNLERRTGLFELLVRTGQLRAPPPPPLIFSSSFLGIKIDVSLLSSIETTQLCPRDPPSTTIGISRRRTLRCGHG